VLDPWEVLSLQSPPRRECGRPKRQTGEPCRNWMNAHWAACHAHMTAAERTDARRLDDERLERVAHLQRLAYRRPLVRYLRWRTILPDLSLVPSEHQWAAFRSAHGERCALCGGSNGRRVIDHDHTTGLVRGFLCAGCNGKTPSDTVHVPYRRLGLPPHIALYCQYPPTAVMGVRFRYKHPFGYAPDPHVRQILWHADPDGVECEWSLYLDRSIPRA